MRKARKIWLKASRFLIKALNLSAVQTTATGRGRWWQVGKSTLTSLLSTLPTYPSSMPSNTPNPKFTWFQHYCLFFNKIYAIRVFTPLWEPWSAVKYLSQSISFPLHHSHRYTPVLAHCGDQLQRKVTTPLSPGEPWAHVQHYSNQHLVLSHPATPEWQSNKKAPAKGEALGAN